MRVQKWIVLGFIGLLLVFMVMLIYSSTVANPRVIAEIRAEPDGARAQKVMVLTFPDGRTLPVNYLKEDNLVFVGADGPWWRQFRQGNVPVQVEIRGQLMTGQARTVVDDPQYTQAVFARLRPNVPKWLPDFLNAYLVVIEISDSA
jgi:hypothetical protein